MGNAKQQMENDPVATARGSVTRQRFDKLKLIGQTKQPPEALYFG